MRLVRAPHRPQAMQAAALAVLMPAVLLAPWAAAQGGSAQRAQPPPEDMAALVALQQAITNWAEFSAAAGLRGWNASTPACTWTGVTCSDAGRVQSL